MAIRIVAPGGLAKAPVNRLTRLVRHKHWLFRYDAENRNLLAEAM